MLKLLIPGFPPSPWPQQPRETGLTEGSHPLLQLWGVGPFIFKETGAKRGIFRGCGHLQRSEMSHDAWGYGSSRLPAPSGPAQSPLTAPQLYPQQND